VFMGAGGDAAVGAQVAASLDTGVLGLWIALEAMMLVRFASLVWRLRTDAWTLAGEELPAEAI
jgi:Na+-driven multidrug efflux pump